jgi:hypothetical protein
MRTCDRIAHDGQKEHAAIALVSETGGILSIPKKSWREIKAILRFCPGEGRRDANR